MVGRVQWWRADTGRGIALEVWGPQDAPTVLFLHGVGQTRHSWRRAADVLAARGYRVLCYDARGHGESDWATDGDYSIAALASDLTAVLSIASAPVALVGASLGGLTAFQAVASSPRPMAEALVMVDVSLRPVNSGVRQIRAFMEANGEGFSSVHEAESAVAAYRRGRARPPQGQGLRRHLRERDGRLFWHWDPRLIDSLFGRLPDYVNELIAGSAGVTIPTLLVRGENSNIVDDASVSEMIRLVPHVEVFDIADCDHMVVGDHNDAFSSAVFAFLDRHLPLSR